MITPWGEAENIKEFDNGNIVIVDTAGHGGVGILDDSELSETAKTIGEYCGGRIWFEEDCAFSIAVLEMPSVEDAYNSIYGGDIKVLSLRLAEGYYPEYMDKEWDI